MASAGRPSFRVDARELSQLLNDAKAFDRDLGLRLRKNIRDAAKPVVKQMQETLVTGDSSSRGFGRLRKKSVRRAVGRQQYFDKNGKARTRTTYRAEKQLVYERVKVRQLIAEGISFRLSTGKAAASGKFVASASKMPDSRKALVKAFNKKSFRHPYFGDRDRWYEQEGRPYFGSVVLENTEPILNAVERALNTAAAKLGRTR